MTDQQDPIYADSDLARGLPMLAESDPQALANEKKQLTALEEKGFFQRWRGYFSLTGPGWLQSAILLGSGSAMGSLFAGAYLEYKLLWVQPLAMILGVIMFAAMAHQALSTGLRPFYAMKRFIHPAMAWAWALGALFATILWHLPQYAIAAGMTEDMIKVVTKWQPTSTQETLVLITIGLVVLVFSTAITWSYGSGRKGIRIYEKTLKGMVWMIIIAFALVIIRQAFAGFIDWGKLFKGFLPLDIPTDKRGVSIVMALFGAATGINASFLFPYTLLARGWAKEHRGLSRFDLITGMLLPFCVATTLMVIATACTIYDPQYFTSGSTMLPPTKAAEMLQAAGLSMFFSRIVFGLGVLGMALSTITMQMLVAGFAACEIFGAEPGGWRYKLACLIPAPAVVGVIFWKYMGPWVAIPSSAICGSLMPIAYVGFFILNNSKKYLGEDKPGGKKAIVWNIAMLIAILVSITSVCYYLYSIFS
ncbi:MAG: divalent metal cation transporter [Planctomycetota bacterium]|jgi:Mn2+/Fe2+ NRAMP family transporter